MRFLRIWRRISCSQHCLDFFQLISQICHLISLLKMEMRNPDWNRKREGFEKNFVAPILRLPIADGGKKRKSDKLCCRPLMVVVIEKTSLLICSNCWKVTKLFLVIHVSEKQKKEFRFQYQLCRFRNYLTIILTYHSNQGLSIKYFRFNTFSNA